MFIFTKEMSILIMFHRIRIAPGEVSEVGRAVFPGPGRPQPQAMGHHQEVLGREGHNSGPHFAKMTSGQGEPYGKCEIGKPVGNWLIAQARGCRLRCA